uniref:C2H2-type domain-containing protein n=1 Tax=Rhodnius prolixus TaxID=13249 RepID=T1HQ37_RHOPR
MANSILFLGRYICIRCGRSYGKKYTLNCHLRYECGMEPQFPCKYCPYKAKRRSSLKVHQLTRHRQELFLTRKTIDTNR